MCLYINNNSVPNNRTIYLIYGSTYEITCEALFSRPLVSLSIFFDNIDLNTYSNSSITQSSCNSNSTLCNSILKYNLTLNDSALSSISTIRCNAFNMTRPYDLNITKVFNIQIDIPSVCV